MPDAYIGMGLTAENVAKKFHVERAVQEAFAIASHKKAAAANFAEEITPITTRTGVVDTDGTIRANSTPEDLAKQKARSKALGLVLGALVILFFIVTIAKLGGNVWNREL
jgi:acetyl-CoA acyltransferase